MFIRRLLTFYDHIPYLSQKNGIFVIFSWILDPKFFSKNDPSNLMRGIDCAHSRSVKTLPWSWFRVVCWSENEKNSDFDRIIRVPRARNRLRVFSKRKNAFLVVNCDFSKTRTIDFSHRKLLGSRISGQNPILFHFRFNTLPWIMFKEVFSHFGSARNRFPASNYPCRGHF